MEQWKEIKGYESLYQISTKGNRAKPIIATRLIDGKTIHFDTISQAEREIGSRHISDVLKGKRRQAKGFTFAYKEGGDADDRTYNS